MKENKTKILILIIIVILLFLIVTSTYSKYKSTATGNVSQPIAQWIIKVNGVDITVNPNDLPKTFNIDKINWNWDKFPQVKKPKVCPGMEGYFDITVDPRGSQVSMNYKIEIDDSSISYEGCSLEISKVEEIHGKPGGHYTGVDNGPDIFVREKELSEIENQNQDSVPDIIRVYIKWPDIEENNDEDSKIGMIVDNVIKIPIKFNVIQKTN